jgi:hypothetical protein
VFGVGHVNRCITYMLLYRQARNDLGLSPAAKISLLSFNMMQSGVVTGLIRTKPEKISLQNGVY